jgi:hypothetical protein
MYKDHPIFFVAFRAPTHLPTHRISYALIMKTVAVAILI